MDTRGSGETFYQEPREGGETEEAAESVLNSGKGEGGILRGKDRCILI
jgi:hypothetical protein